MESRTETEGSPMLPSSPSFYFCTLSPTRRRFLQAQAAANSPGGAAAPRKTTEDFFESSHMEQIALEPRRSSLLSFVSGAGTAIPASKQCHAELPSACLLASRRSPPPVVPPVTVDRLFASETSKSYTTLQRAEHEDVLLIADDGDACLICMNEFSGSRRGIRLPCRNRCNENFVHEDCLFEWKMRQVNADLSQGCGTCPLCRSELADFTYAPPDALNSGTLFMFSARRNFCLSPLPREAGVARSYVRITSYSSSRSAYEFYLQQPSTLAYPHGPLPSATQRPGDQLLMVAVSRTGLTGTVTRIYTSASTKSLNSSRSDEQRAKLVTGTPFHLGKVESEFSGLGHRVYQTEISGKKNGEIGAVLFCQNRYGAGYGPRVVSVAIPEGGKADGEASAAIDSETSARGERRKKNLLRKLRMTKKGEVSPQGSDSTTESNDAGILRGTNVKPRWNESRECYSLDFRGRVRYASNKNFQLNFEGVKPSPHSVAIQFGKVGDHPTKTYTCDFQWPLSPLQAFGICLAASVPKLSVA